MGQVGDGPGDFRRPRALAQLDDGRVLLTNQLFHRRLTLFHPDGTLDDVVRVDDAHFVGLGVVRERASVGGVRRVKVGRA